MKSYYIEKVYFNALLDLERAKRITFLDSSAKEPVSSVTGFLWRLCCTRMSVKNVNPLKSWATASSWKIVGKMCTRQSRKVLWVVFISRFLGLSTSRKKSEKTMTRHAMSVCFPGLKESNKSRLNSYSIMVVPFWIVARTFHRQTSSNSTWLETLRWGDLHLVNLYLLRLKKQSKLLFR